jgi:hypothetical protein
MSSERGSPESDDFRNVLIPSKRLLEALTGTLEVFGPSMKEATLLELQKSGIDLERDAREHSLADLGDKLSSIFGKDGTDVILEQIGKRLNSQH